MSDYYMEVSGTWKDRLGYFLFPQTYLAPWPGEGEDGYEPGWADGDLTLGISIHLDWLDRIRVLVSGKLSVRTRTKTNVAVGNAKTKSLCHVLPPWVTAEPITRGLTSLMVRV